MLLAHRTIALWVTNAVSASFSMITTFELNVGRIAMTYGRDATPQARLSAINSIHRASVRLAYGTPLQRYTLAAALPLFATGLGALVWPVEAQGAAT